jgi:hypothetical protein
MVLLVSLEITLSNAQVRALAAVADDHPHAVTVRNEGDPFLLLDLHDEDGRVVDRFRMPYEEPALVRLTS